jgi:hypothetical protein
LRYGREEIRFDDEPPFALYPGEQLVTLAPLQFVEPVSFMLLLLLL